MSFVAAETIAYSIPVFGGVTDLVPNIVLSCTGSLRAFAYASSHEGSLAVFTLSYMLWRAFIILSKVSLYEDCSNGFRLSYSLFIIAAGSTTSFILDLPGFSSVPSLGPKYGVASASSLRLNTLSTLSVKVFVTGSINI